MAQMVGADDIESMRIELAEIERSLRMSFTSSRSIMDDDDDDDGIIDNGEEQHHVQWAEIERLPTFKRMRSSLLDEDGKGRKVVDVTKLKDQERHVFIHKLIQHIEDDNLRLLRKIRDRIDKVGVKLPTVEVRYKNLCVESKCKVVHGKPLPTLWNSLISTFMSIAKLGGLKPKEATVRILNDVSGVIKPGRMTLLLGPPGCGKTTLLKALSGSLDDSLKVAGEVSYNGYKLHEFVPQKSSAYISQSDLHLPEMTVRETLNFSGRCHGVGSRADIMLEVSKREKEAGIVPDPDIDAYMKAVSLHGLKRTLQTDYILKILGLDICADTYVGDPIRRGISGGQKRRLTTGEMIVGPTKVLFMDEITNGLDSSTAFQIVACILHFVHITDATVLISLLQPAPEVFNLFDDIILMAEENIVYHGPRNQVLEFFEHCGFRCPERKGVADFLQEVISIKDQAQYWYKTDQHYSYLSAGMLSKLFKASSFGKKLSEDFSGPYDKSQSHRDALSFSVSSLPKWELLRVCMSRELLLMRRNSFLYIFKTSQLIVMALVSMTIFLQTHKNIDIFQANYYMSSMYYSLVIFVIDTFPELSLVVARLPVFYKQKELGLYPAWSYAIPVSILKIPISIIQSLIWTSLTYFVIGYSPEVQRFFFHFMTMFAAHFASMSMFRFIASVFQTSVASLTAGSFAMMFVLGCGGFLIELPSLPVWLKWGFWSSPCAYAQIGLSVNEFHAPRWKKISGNSTIGQEILENRGLDFDGYFLWISLAALFGFALLFNIGFTLALSFLSYRGSTSRIISHEEVNQIKENKVFDHSTTVEENPLPSISNAIMKTEKGGTIVLPFEPLSVVFQDVQYYVDTPLAMRKNGFNQRKLQLLHDVTGTLRPGILTALMGASGAGKTTLLDVLAGRKNSGYIQGEIRIGGYPKVQETFARISAYCEQNDTHSPQITVEESVLFSAWLRLSPQIDSKTKTEFVKEVLETVELGKIKDAIVGIPGLSGLSNEQRKRLTIAVELVANPSIIFMDEPTTGLDARAAAIVMRAVKNIANMGRTIVCTIHQPSIHIFEAFDELILLKNGGRMIYSGPLGHNSSKVVEYFEGIPGVPKIRDNYNPATWMLDATSTSAEVKFGVDFAQIYKSSVLYENNKELVKQLSTPAPGARNLEFETRFSLNGWGQYKACLWKQCLSYWRSPAYNYKRIMMTVIASLFFGLLYFRQGKELDNQQSLFKMFGAIYQGVMFIGVANFTSVLPYVATERAVMYRERFAGMYSSCAYSLAQVSIEIPYIFIQGAVNVIITYPIVGYYISAYKIFWYFYAMFCALLTYNYVGMLMVSLTPNIMVATTISSSILTSFNLFSGFIIPKTKIPKWWLWMYYLIPTSWSLNGLLTSQYGDIEKEIEVFGEKTTVAAFLKDYFGFDKDFLPIVAIILIVYPIIIASLFAYFIGKLNFQRR